MHRRSMALEDVGSRLRAEAYFSVRLPEIAASAAGWAGPCPLCRREGFSARGNGVWLCASCCRSGDLFALEFALQGGAIAALGELAEKNPVAMADLVVQVDRLILAHIEGRHFAGANAGAVTWVP